ncbi:hypothetical protein A9O66_27935 [Paraburkholderia caribensis]|nr:hypothetical protein A9O66_27935 [Paraburkholderia caribensis]
MLVAIADLGQLRKVAEYLHVTPPAVSKQLAEMEEALKQKILKREGNRIGLTDAGELLARHARLVLVQLERTRQELGELCTGAAGHVSLGAAPTVAPFLLPALLAYLRERTPATAVTLHEGLLVQQHPMLENGTLDIVVARETGYKLPAAFSSESVLSDPLAVVCGARDPLVSKRRLEWHDLSGRPWLLPFKNTATRSELDRLLDAHKLTLPQGCVESISLSVNVSLLQASRFVALMPLAYVQRYLGRDLVHVLPLSTGGIQSSIKVIWRKDNSNPVVSMLLEAILKKAILV